MSEVAAIERPIDAEPTDSAPAEPVDTRQFRAITLGMVSLVVLQAYQALAVTTAMPTVAKALHGLSLYAMAFAAPMATGVIGMVTAGIWCDRRGPAGPLRAGVGLFITGMVLVGFATRMELVVLGRSVHGLGSGLLLVSIYVVIGRAYPESLRPGVFVAISAHGWCLDQWANDCGLTVQYFDLAQGLLSSRLGRTATSQGPPALRCWTGRTRSGL